WSLEALRRSVIRRRKKTFADDVIIMT
ncbi:hypothetical protein Tco_0594359, partial [Tanacetum coccineum]